MRIECEACGAGYRIQPGPKAKRARCKCGATLLVPASGGADEEEEPKRNLDDVLASTEAEERKRSKAALASAVLTLFLALPYFGFFGLLSAMSSGTRLGLGPADSDAMVVAGAITFPAMLVTLLLGGGIGVWLLKPWGWYTAIVAHGSVALFNAKLVTPVFDINYDHARANEVFLDYFVAYGVPILISLVGIVLLMLNGTRKACGVKSEAYQRRKRTVGAR